MKLCISNIAWSPAQDLSALELLASLGVTNLELAPTRWWPDLSVVLPCEIEGVRKQWRPFGIKPVCFQSVLFGRPELCVFGGKSSGDCLRYLQAVIHLASQMEVSVVVFGSPRNRVRGSLAAGEAQERAISFFRSVGMVAADCGVRFCFEPNPSQYGTDFGCTTEESVALVEAVDSPGFWLNIDAGAIALNGEDASAVVHRTRNRIGHVHISEPYLVDFSNPVGPHNNLGSALLEIGYTGYVSLEMRARQDYLATVRQAIAFAKSVYRC